MERDPKTTQAVKFGVDRFTAKAAEELSLAVKAAKELLMNHPHKVPKAYAYVAYGDPAQDMLNLLRIEVLGPSESQEVFAMKLSHHETTWVPMEVAHHDIVKMQEMGLVDESHIGNTLLLSFPSLSRDEEMRFRLNRAFVEDGDATSYVGKNGHLNDESIEILVSDIEPETWTEEEWPRDGVKVEEWGHSLRCLSFADKHT